MQNGSGEGLSQQFQSNMANQMKMMAVMFMHSMQQNAMQS